MLDPTATPPSKPTNETEASYAVGQLRGLRRSRLAAEKRVAELHRHLVQPIVEQEQALQSVLERWAASQDSSFGPQTILLPGATIKPAPPETPLVVTDRQALLEWAVKHCPDILEINLEALHQRSVPIPDRAVLLADTASHAGEIPGVERADNPPDRFTVDLTDL